MSETLSPQEIERRALESGLSVKALCDRAKISHTTFYRWKSGQTTPSIDVYERLCTALREPADD